MPPGGGAATTWTDATVALGARYEYFVSRGGTVPGRTFVTAGVEAVPLENRGKLVLLVDATKATALGARLDRLIEDLTGDGWTVLRHDVLPTATVPSVKALITADVAANPGQVKSIFLLGRIPVPYSGALNPDGHSDHFGAWPADVYYGELNGTWTDTSINTVVASRPENRNVPGDGKFDQTALPSDVDIAVGRVDLSNMPSFGVSETVLLERYLDKDHDYRHKVFAVDQRAVIDDNFGYFGGEAFAASGWRNFAPLVGPANITAADYFTTLNTASGNGYSWSYGCGGGSYQSAGGIGSTIDFVNSQNRSVFTMLFGSYFGDWDVADNFLRAPLCTGWTLTNMWAGRPHSSFHPMGLGDTVGAGARLSQNDTGAGGFGTRWVHIALMGDPTLRQHIIAPPSGVAVADLWPQANISWNPSTDLVAGYHVYRATSPQGPFTRLTTAPVAGTIFTDQAPIAGDSTYLVRALRLETTPTGTYWNLSQGAFATQRLPQQAAAHTTFGAGCYAISDSLYQYFATPALASAALSGQSITFTPARAANRLRELGLQGNSSRARRTAAHHGTDRGRDQSGRRTRRACRHHALRFDLRHHPPPNPSRRRKHPVIRHQVPTRPRHQRTQTFHQHLLRHHHVRRAVLPSLLQRIRHPPIRQLRQPIRRDRCASRSDGATSSNDFHCGMNFAAVYKSPCVLFCQNNQWAISVPISKQSASETIAQKGKAYGMPYVRVDGNDVLAVYPVTREAVARARKGLGPTFIEAVTYRRLGHSSSDDPTRYRDEAEVKIWEKKDPVDRLRAYLVKRKLWDDSKEAAFKDDIAQRVNDAIAKAESFGPPADETLVTDVYAQVPQQLKDQLAEVLALEGRGVNEGAFPL